MQRDTAQSLPTQILHGFIKKIIEKCLFPAEIRSIENVWGKPNFNFLDLEKSENFSTWGNLEFQPHQKISFFFPSHHTLTKVGSYYYGMFGIFMHSKGDFA